MRLQRLLCALVAGLACFAFLRPANAEAPLRGYVRVDAGSQHACALSTGGGVVCWGGNGSGQLGDGSTMSRPVAVDVSGLSSGVSAVATGGAHTCALTEAGGVKCWGANSWGQLGDGSITNRLTPVEITGLSSGATAIAAGGSHTCALSAGGGVQCWGNNSEGQLGDGSFGDLRTPVDVSGLGSGVKALAAGARHTCALTTVGGVKCWGADSEGQLGDGAFGSLQRTPVDVSGLSSGVTSISAGGNHTCAVTATDGVKCWGSNSFGELGNGSTSARQFTPVDVHGLGIVVEEIDAGLWHTCARTVEGDAQCWGLNHYGQLGDSTTTNRLTPVNVAGISGGGAVASGLYFTCAVTTGDEVKCWGSNSEGQLGDGTTFNRPTPVGVDELGTGVSAAATGDAHTCALTAIGGVSCWGRNTDGQLGDSSALNRNSPVNVSGLAIGALGISTGFSHSCALTVAGGVKCWGNNFVGQVGDGSIEDRLSPVDVSGLGGGVSAIAAGRLHTCALTTIGGVKCWGSNVSGALGDGTTTQRLAPVDVSGLGSGVRAIAAGGSHTCALTTAGGVKCWGRNLSGQLGDGSTAARITPTDVIGLGSGVSAIATGDLHTCALTSVGGVKCWGSNSSGRLGDGTTTQRNTPTDVIGLGSGVIAISAGTEHTCAVTTSGRAQCWGRGHFGQIGDGSLNAGRGTPTDVSGLSSGVLTITAGGAHTCAVTASDGLKCWGSDSFGQVGDGGRDYVQPGNVLINDLPRKVIILTPAADGPSRQAKTDASGRYIVFESTASNLLGAGMDTNGTSDIFRLDRLTGIAVRVSVSNDGSQLVGGDAIEPSVSADGQLVVFVAPTTAVKNRLGESQVTEAQGSKGAGSAVFLRNLRTGTTQRVGTQPARGRGSNPVIAPDGNTVVFTGTNANPTQGATGQDNVFLVRFDRGGDALLPRDTECVSCKSRSVMGLAVADADGASRNAVVSADGTWVAFETEAKNALETAPSPCASVATREIIVRNMATGIAHRVSPPSMLNSLNCGALGSTNPSIDWSGLNIAFTSDAALTSGSISGTNQVFLKDANGAIRRLSQTAAGAVANGASDQAALSGDGRSAVFVTSGTNLDSNFPDTNDEPDIHAVRLDRSIGIERLSKTTSGAEANDTSNRPALNHNGTLVVFDSAATNLVPTDSNGNVNDVFQRAVPANSKVVFGSDFE